MWVINPQGKDGIKGNDMLNEERIKLMTKMASYEANEGKRNVSIGSYFRGDYISIQVIKSIFAATIAFAVCFMILNYLCRMYIRWICWGLGKMF